MAGWGPALLVPPSLKLTAPAALLSSWVCGATEQRAHTGVTGRAWRDLAVGWDAALQSSGVMRCCRAPLAHGAPEAAIQPLFVEAFL